MKNLKVVFAFLSIILLSGFIYFSNEGFSTQPSASEDKSTDITITVQVLGTELCLGNGNLKYCVNGGGLMSFPSNGEIKVPCNTPITICVLAGTGCCGSWSGQLDCDVIGLPYTLTITLANNEGRCCRCA